MTPDRLAASDGDLPEAAFAAALASLPGVGPATLRRLLAAPEPPSAAWSRLTPDATAGIEVAQVWQRHQEREIGVHRRGRPGFPERLAGDPDAPAVLFTRGDLEVLNRYPTVALVGTRSPTRYGISVAAQFGADLAAAGVSVVSGLALGIDGAAHEGACAAGAPPVAVVAGGLDDPYPRRHARLFERVAQLGVVVSESPAGVRTEKWRFPVRNQLLAKLSDVVVVVESRHGGGSRHTVHAALAGGTPVGAVPGSIRSRTSEGTNALLADGAFPVCDVGDILMALSLTGARDPRPGEAGPPTAPAVPRRPPPDYQGPDRALLDVLSAEPSSLDQLARAAGLDLPALCGGLERLATAGVARDIGGWWERV
ncbi:MAG TPA: DNA-processing protein DprA [Acidimicrobiales bacterium]|jgi:DNA processing protein